MVPDLLQAAGLPEAGKEISLTLRRGEITGTAHRLYEGGLDRHTVVGGGGLVPQTEEECAPTPGVGVGRLADDAAAVGPVHQAQVFDLEGESLLVSQPLIHKPYLPVKRIGGRVRAPVVHLLLLAANVEGLEVPEELEGRRARWRPSARCHPFAGTSPCECPPVHSGGH